MKKTNFFYRSAMFFGALGLLFTSCESDTLPGIEVDKNAPAVEILATGETVDYTFTANEAWTASVDESWVVITPASGKGGGKATVSISAEVNKGFANRTANVTFKAGETTISVKVTQFSAIPSITFSPDTVAIKPSFKDVVSVTSNVTYIVISKPEWLEVTLPTTMIGTQDMALEVTVTSDLDRSGNIELAETGTTKVLATIPVSVKKTLAATTTMLKTNFAANQFYVMPTHSDISIKGMEDGEFRLIGIELNGSTLGNEAAWLTFARNENFEKTLVYSAKVSDYTSKTAVRNARIFLAPKDLSNTQIIAAGDKFKVADVKQFPDAVQFINKFATGPNIGKTFRGLDFLYGNQGGNAYLEVIPNDFPFFGTTTGVAADSLARGLDITNKNTAEQAERVTEITEGFAVNPGGKLPVIRGVLAGLSIIDGQGATYTKYYGVKVVVEGVIVEGLFMAIFTVATSPVVSSVENWFNEVPVKNKAKR